MAEKVVVIMPGAAPEIREYDKLTYPVVRQVIDGSLEYTAVPERPGVYIVSDEEFLLKTDMAFNRRYNGYPFLGPMMFVSVDNQGETIGLKAEDIVWVLSSFGPIPSAEDAPSEEEIRNIFGGMSFGFF